MFKSLPHQNEYMHAGFAQPNQVVHLLKQKYLCQSNISFGQESSFSNYLINPNWITLSSYYNWSIQLNHTFKLLVKQLSNANWMILSIRIWPIQVFQDILTGVLNGKGRKGTFFFFFLILDLLDVEYGDGDQTLFVLLPPVPVKLTRWMYQTNLFTWRLLFSWRKKSFL